jgi:membrane associated rhomboid family serine protease
MNVPGKTIFSFQIWRLFTAVFYTPSLLSIIFGFMSWAPDAVRLEYTSGTVRYFLNFMVNATLINIIYCLLMLLLSVIVKAALYMPSSGLWPLILAEITMLCLANPDNQMTFFFIPIKFPAKYYPWILLGFFTLINMSFQFDNLVGVCYGHLFFYFLRQKLQFSDTFINKVENYRLVSKISTIGKFIPLKSTSGAVFNQSEGNNNNNYVVERDTTPVTTPFKGKGTTIGK